MNLSTAPLRIRTIRALLHALPRGRYPALSRLERWIGGTVPFRGKIGPYDFQVELQDSVAREAYFTGCHEHGFSALLHTVLRPGDAFVDVGANFGYFTLFGRGAVTSIGRCVAFEPDPVNLKRLAMNLALNGWSDVIVVPKFCGATPETVLFHGIDGSENNWGIGSRYSRTSVSVRMEVSQVRIDDELGTFGMKHVRLCKMDIEGGELDAMRGFSKYVDRGAVDCFLLECHEAILNDQGQTVRPVLDMLVDRGYAVRRIEVPRGAYSIRRFQGRLVPLDMNRLEPWFHVVAYLPERCSWLEGTRG